jgi:pimeloyl-ACP methyl ester carboxylesterase
MDAVWLFAAALLCVLCAFFLFTLWRVRQIEARYPHVGDRVDGIHIVDQPAQGRERGSVLLVHGASGNHADMTAALGARLTALGFRTLAVDRPGHGWSAPDSGRRSSSPARQGALIREALARRGVTQAIVVVHSWAGVVGLALALEAPAFTRALVLLAPASHPWLGGVSWYYTLAATPGLGRLFRHLIVMPVGLMTMQSGVDSVFAPERSPADYIDATKLPLLLRPAQFLANARDVVDLKSFVTEWAPRYRRIDAPTAIVTGDSDGIVYTHIHALGCARDISGATLTISRASAIRRTIARLKASLRRY